MKIYKVAYFADVNSFRDTVYYTDVVARRNIIIYANRLWVEGCISEDTIRSFLEKYGHKPKTSKQALELLQDDGYYVLESEVQ